MALGPGENRADCRREASDSLLAPIAPWTAVRPLGEDMVATELVLPANHILRPVDLGALAGSGHATVDVRRKPRVAVIPTGTELITVEQAAQSGVKSGDIIEYNSIVLAAEVEQWGGAATRFPIVIDDFEKIKATVREAAATLEGAPFEELMMELAIMTGLTGTELPERMAPMNTVLDLLPAATRDRMLAAFINAG